MRTTHRDLNHYKNQTNQVAQTRQHMRCLRFSVFNYRSQVLQNFDFFPLNGDIISDHQWCLNLKPLLGLTCFHHFSHYFLSLCAIWLSIHFFHMCKYKQHISSGTLLAKREKNRTLRRRRRQRMSNKCLQ